MEASKRQELAESYFLEGYNCSQALILAFSDLINIEKKELVKLASSFGGGMCRYRSSCGALSSSMMIIGLIFGYDTPETGEKKQKLYEIGQEFISIFNTNYNYTNCSDLLGEIGKENSPKPTPRDINFYTQRPCKNIIGKTAFLLTNFIDSKKKI